MRGESIKVMQSANQPTQGGSIPTSPLFHKADWEVRTVSLSTVQHLVRLHHYMAGGSNTAVYRHGLFRRDSFWETECAGAAWWIPPTKTAAQSAYPENWRGVLALSRLVIIPGVPANACSFLIRHSMRMIDRKVWPCLLSYADTEWRGHTGAIYLAAGWKEDGWTKPERLYVRNGVVVSRKAGPKTRTHAEMLALGCELVGTFRKKRFIHIQGSRGTF